MSSMPDPTGEHLQVMEARIKAQVALVVRLKQIGQDASEAMRRLDLLQRALQEMRLQLARLAPTEMDAKNRRANGVVTRLLGKKTA
jgi:hypothetical protein